jgi:hypothetical protein
MSFLSVGMCFATSSVYTICYLAVSPASPYVATVHTLHIISLPHLHLPVIRLTLHRIHHHERPTELADEHSVAFIVACELAENAADVRLLGGEGGGGGGGSGGGGGEGEGEGEGEREKHGLEKRGARRRCEWVGNEGRRGGG